MLAELSSKQHALDDLARAFQRLRSFALELQRSTKGKRFAIHNELVWDAVLSLRRIIVIDLDAWVKSLSREWLRRNLQGLTLSQLRTSKRYAAKLAETTHFVASDPDTLAFLRRHEVDLILEGRRDALKLLFGTDVAKRGEVRQTDVARLERKLETWAKNLAALRNHHAHRYGYQSADVKALRLPDLAKRIQYCGRILNALRLLIDRSSFSMPSLEPSQNDPRSRDAVDLLVLGTIEYVVESWAPHPGRFGWQKRQVEYARLHRRRRKRGEVFNA